MVGCRPCEGGVTGSKHGGNFPLIIRVCPGLRAWVEVIVLSPQKRSSRLTRLSLVTFEGFQFFMLSLSVLVFGDWEQMERNSCMKTMSSDSSTTHKPGRMIPAHPGSQCGLLVRRRLLVGSRECFDRGFHRTGDSCRKKNSPLVRST